MTACGADAPDAAPAEAGPQRIVSMSPTSTEVLFAIGAGDLVVAADEYSNHPSQAPAVAGLSNWQPNAEAVLAYEPDLVVLSDEQIVAPLEAAGVAVMVAEPAASFEDALAQIIATGQVVGREAQAAQLVDDLRARYDRVVERAAGPVAAAGLTYFHELDDNLFSVTSATFVGATYGALGLTNVADVADPDGFGYPQLSAEYLLEADPDLIFLADGACCGQTAETVSARPGWSTMTAVANQHIFDVDPDIASRWGPRVVDFMEQVVGLIARAGLAEIDAE